MTPQAAPIAREFRVSLGSPSGDPVVDLLSIPGVKIFGDEDVLYAATAGGIFRKCSPIMNCLWQPVGKIPATPTALAAAGKSKTLYAGTGKGVYAFVDATGMISRNPQQRLRDGRTPIYITGSRVHINASAGTMVWLHDAAGKIVCSGVSGSGGVTFDRFKPGVHFCRTSDMP